MRQRFEYLNQGANDSDKSKCFNDELRFAEQVPQTSLPPVKYQKSCICQKNMFQQALKC